MKVPVKTRNDIYLNKNEAAEKFNYDSSIDNKKNQEKNEHAENYTTGNFFSII